MGNDKLSCMFILWILDLGRRIFKRCIRDSSRLINSSFSTKVLLKVEDIRALKHWLAAQEVSYDMSVQSATFTRPTNKSRDGIAANVSVASRAALKSHFKPGLQCTSNGLEIGVTMTSGEQVSLYFFDSPDHEKFRRGLLNNYEPSRRGGGGRGGGGGGRGGRGGSGCGIDGYGRGYTLSSGAGQEENSEPEPWDPIGSTYILVPGRDMRPVEALMEAVYDFMSTTERRKLTVFTVGSCYSHSGFGWEQRDMNRLARPLDSVILPAGEADEMLADARKFLSRQQWYTDRGLPYRRGYLLFGVPGGGKTSLVEAIAGELQLPVYWLSMSTPDMSDHVLMDLISSVEPQAILLLEDIDAAFQNASKVEKEQEREEKNKGERRGGERRGVERRGGERGVGSSFVGGRGGHQRTMVSDCLTFSGILNALDGMTAAEGRLLYMTTNHKENLDPALIRPGRIDRQLEFKRTTRDQLQCMFEHFYSEFASSDKVGGEGVKGKDDGMERMEKKENIIGFFGMLRSLLGFQPTKSGSPSSSHAAASPTDAAPSLTSSSIKETKQLVRGERVDGSRSTGTGTETSRKWRVHTNARKFAWIVTEGVHTAAEVLAYFQLHDTMEDALTHARAWDSNFSMRQHGVCDLDAERLRRLPPHPSTIPSALAYGSEEGSAGASFLRAFGQFGLGRQNSEPLARSEPWA